MAILRRITIGTLAITLFSACKPVNDQGTTELQTVANLSGLSSFQPNSCGYADYVASARDRHSARISGNANDDLYAALGAAPRLLVDIFFNQLQGRIEVNTPRAAEALAKGSPAEQAFLSERGRSKLTAGFAGNPLTLYLSEQYQGHNVIRSLAYVYSQSVQAMLASEDPKARAAGEAEQAYLDFLAKQLLQELQSKNAPLAPAYADFYAQDPQAASLAAFSDVLDSMYCDIDSYTGLIRDYPATYAAFTDDALVKSETSPFNDAYIRRFGAPAVSQYGL